jgi:hypothetical protein
VSEITRGELQDLLIKFSQESPKYREALVKNPKLVLSKQLGTQIPDWLTVKAVQDTADTMHVIVPYVPREGEELSDTALEQVAGGKDDDKNNTYNCNEAQGVATRVNITTEASLF